MHVSTLHNSANQETVLLPVEISTLNTMGQVLLLMSWSAMRGFRQKV